MFVFVYIDSSEEIAIIQGTTLDKINKGIRKAIQNDEMMVENLDSSENWNIYAIIGGELVPHENYAFVACYQFL